MAQAVLAEKLRVLRARAGLTLTEVAERSGIGRDTLGYIERGTRHPSVPTLSKIAKAYNIPVEDLLEGVEAPLGQAPPESGETEEERREELRNIRELLVDVHALLEDQAQAYQASGDGSKLTTLLSVAMFVVLGAEQFVREEVGSEAEDRESMRIHTAGARLEELVEDLQDQQP